MSEIRDAPMACGLAWARPGQNLTWSRPGLDRFDLEDLKIPTFNDKNLVWTGLAKSATWIGLWSESGATSLAGQQIN